MGGLLLLLTISISIIFHQHDFTSGLCRFNPLVGYNLVLYIRSKCMLALRPIINSHVIHDSVFSMVKDVRRMLALILGYNLVQSMHDSFTSFSRW